MCSCYQTEGEHRASLPRASVPAPCSTFHAWPGETRVLHHARELACLFQKVHATGKTAPSEPPILTLDQSPAPIQRHWLSSPSFPAPPQPLSPQAASVGRT